MNKLKDLRQSIDNIDTAFIFLLAERTRVIAKVGSIKKQQNISLDYSEERKTDLQKILHIAEQSKLFLPFVQQLFAKIYAESIHLMQAINDLSEPIFNDMDLTYLRESIYNLDIAICHVLAERFHAVRQVALLKKQHQLKPLAANRWQAILDKQSKIADTLGVNSEFVIDIMNLIHAESLRIEHIKTGSE
jgi:chorismate mutase